MAKAAEKTTETKELVPVQENLPAEADYGDYAGAGFENQSSADYSIPFIGVLQAISPELETIEGAKAGMLINTVTKELYDGKKGVSFIPAETQHVYVEWVPRSAGGGFVAVHKLDSDVVVAAKERHTGEGQIKLPNGNELIETFYVYGVMVDGEGNASPAVIAFTSTKIKKYKAWMTRARAIQIALPGGRRITPPLFAHQYRVKTVSEENKKGKFHNFHVEFDGDSAPACRLAPSDPRFQAAASIYEMVRSGAAKAAYDSQSSTDAGSAGGADDAPF